MEKSKTICCSNAEMRLIFHSIHKRMNSEHHASKQNFLNYTYEVKYNLDVIT